MPRFGSLPRYPPYLFLNAAEGWHAMNGATLMKLYKFRPLGDDLSFCRAKEILRTGEFWCSRFWELNDPMEGVYSFSAADRVNAGDVFSEKARYVICSFSGEEAFSNPAIWGYYANAFKGVAIEIEIEIEIEVPDNGITKMNYVKDVDHRREMEESLTAADPVKKILTTKLDRWKHEKEFRFLCKTGEPGPKLIGEIKAVHFGDPYRKIENQNIILDRSQGLRTFRTQRSTLQALAEAQDIPWSFMTVSEGKVESEPAGAK